MPSCTVNGLGHVFEHEVEENLVRLVAIRVEKELEVANVGVRNKPHNLEFTVLERSEGRVRLEQGLLNGVKPTLNRLSCSTFLIATHSPFIRDGEASLAY